MQWSTTRGRSGCWMGVRVPRHTEMVAPATDSPWPAHRCHAVHGPQASAFSLAVRGLCGATATSLAWSTAGPTVTSSTFTNLRKTLVSNQSAMVPDTDMWMTAATQFPIMPALQLPPFPGPVLISSKTGDHDTKLLWRVTATGPCVFSKPRPLRRSSITLLMISALSALRRDRKIVVNAHANCALIPRTGCPW